MRRRIHTSGMGLEREREREREVRVERGYGGGISQQLRV
jgi:hypothetical protein